MAILENAVFLAFLLSTADSLAYGQANGLKTGFYSSTCPRAEAIVKSTAESHFKANPMIARKLLRKHFHDCFVHGCDGSILIDGNDAEKTSVPNLSLGPAFPIIDNAKTQLEAACPGVVSCADIVTLASRDAVLLTKQLDWSVPPRRRDGRVSSASDTNGLPSPFDPIDMQKQMFSPLGLITKVLVTLVTGHTIGTAAYQFISDRLDDFNNANGASDPSINPSFLPKLKALCPENGDGTERVDLDAGSADTFDTSYYSNLKDGRAILDSDQALWADELTKGRGAGIPRHKGTAWAEL